MASLIVVLLTATTFWHLDAGSGSHPPHLLSTQSGHDRKIGAQWRTIMANKWTCPACAKVRRSQFCPQCGEERLRARDLTLRDLAEQFAKKMTSVDGKLLRTSRAVLTQPGMLTTAYLRGERRQYLAPLALFLL